ncbi:MAG: FAD binding domain-containing protein [Pseudomonadota bacterium]
MPIKVQTFATAAEAAQALSASRSARFLGGGTVLMRAVNEADPGFDTIVRTTDPALSAIRASGGTVSIGAAVTMAEIARHRETAFLAPVARVIGGPQVRAAATAAGNLFAVPPYGDFAGALLALDATAETSDGRRQSIEDVLRAPNGTPSPMIAHIHVPAPRDGLHFAKISRVKPKGVSLMSIAAVVPRSGGRVENARIVFNGMGPKPMRSSGAERALNGAPLDSAAIGRAKAQAADGLDPADDPVASAWYRREVAGVHLGRLLEGIR